MAGVLVAAPYVVLTVVRNRRVDLLAVFTLSIAIVSTTGRTPRPMTASTHATSHFTGY